MAAVLTFLLILIISILVNKIATIALAHTGMSHETAKFQARSAFSGVGFTTTESERMVTHPVRRRILMMLMLLGNAGIVTAGTSLLLAFVDPESGAISWYSRLLIIVGGAGVLWFLASSQTFDRSLAVVINWGFRHWTNLDTRDYVNLLHLQEEYRVKEMKVQKNDWLANRTLHELALTDEGALILGISRSDGRFIGAPTKETVIKVGDVIIIYGREETIAELDERRAGWEGEKRHRDSVSKQRKVIEKQKEEEAAAEKKEEMEKKKKKNRLNS